MLFAFALTPTVKAYKRSMHPHLDATSCMHDRLAKLKILHVITPQNHFLDLSQQNQPPSLQIFYCSAVLR